MIRIIALTEAGHRLANKIQNIIDCENEIWFKPQPFSEKVQSAFLRGDRLILICATGIAVRTLAPVLQNKKVDPAVLVLDETGEFVIPLLSGHEGGANDLAAEVAELLEATLVKTTARPYIKPVYTVGMGCERNCPIDDLKSLLDECLAQANLTMEQIESINSIDIKSDETGLIVLSKELNKPYQTWNKQQLSEVEDLLSTKSDYIYQVVGVYGVAESAALVAAQKSITSEPSDIEAMIARPELVLNKQKNAKATCAIARTYPADDI